MIAQVKNVKQICFIQYHKSVSEKRGNLKVLKLYEHFCNNNSGISSSTSIYAKHPVSQHSCHSQISYPIYRSWATAKLNALFVTLGSKPNFIPCLQLLGQSPLSHIICSFSVTAKLHTHFPYLGLHPSFTHCWYLLGLSQTLYPACRSWVRDKFHTLLGALGSQLNTLPSCIS